MKVLIVHPHLTIYGGAETIVIRLAQYLTNKRIDNAIVTLSVSPEVSKLSKGLCIIKPSKKYSYKLRSSSFFNLLGTANEIIGLRKLVKENVSSFDVVNFHNFPATWSLFPTSKPCVWLCNEPPDLWNNPNPSIPLRILRNFGVRLDKIIVNKYITYICAADEFNANRLMERYGRKAIIVPYGIDFDFFYKGNGKAAKDKFNLEGKFVLLQVGWISPQKNQLESVRALKKVKEFIPNVKLILAGFDKSQYGTMLKEYVHKNDIQDYVLFTGHLNRVFIRDLYHACDVLLHPVKQQGGWLAPFEALCASKPIIVSYEMTASNIIKREKIGIVTNDFVKAILDIYNNPLPYQEMARKGKLWVADNLSWDKFGEKMVAVFWRALYVEKGKGSH